MRGLSVGFSYRGIHSDQMGIVLGNNTEIMHSISSDFSVTSETVDGYNGAYPTGTKEGAKVFDIDMICEDMTAGDLQRLGWWFERGTGGELIFDHCPYKHYIVRSTSGVTPPVYTYFDEAKNTFIYSGVARVQLTAYYPRAEMNDDVLADYPNNIGSALQTLEDETGIVIDYYRPSKIATDISDVRIMRILNQGNAHARGVIRLSGRFQNGVTIENQTSHQKMTIKTQDNDLHTFMIDSKKGRVTEDVNGVEFVADYAKTGHFIEMMPCMPFLRKVGYTTDRNVMITDIEQPTIQAGQFALINGWKKIVAKEGKRLSMDTILTGSGEATIATLNEIMITPGQGSVVSSIEFDYKDTFY